MGVWCVVDARGEVAGVRPDTRVAGLSLLARHLRLAARCGFEGVLIVADEDVRVGCEAALAEEPAPAHVTVRFAAELPDAEADAGERVWVRMSLYAVYTADALRAAVGSGEAPVALVAIREARDLAAAKRALFASIRKNVDQDGVVAYYVVRIFSRAITRLVINTSISPNQISLSAMMLGVAAALCAGAGTRLGFVAAGLLFWWGTVVDCVDGELARLRLQGSKLGEWLDSMADEVSTYGVLIGLGVGMMRQDVYPPGWVVLAFVGAAVGILVHIKLYADLHRMGGVIDTAQYPWFFGTPSAGGPRSGLWARLTYWLAFCFRRDAFVTFVAILLLVDRPHWAAALLAGGAFVVLGMLSVHLVVMGARARAS